MASMQKTTCRNKTDASILNNACGDSYAGILELFIIAVFTLGFEPRHLLKCFELQPNRHMSTYLCALFLKVFGIFVCLCTALARDSVPLRRWSDTYLYELYHSIPFFVHSLGLIAVTIPSMKTHCVHRASP